MTQQQDNRTRVKIEIRGRITNRRIFDMICAAGDADLKAEKGEFARILLGAIREGKSPVVTGYCTDGKPLRLTNLGQELRIPIIFTIGYEKGRNHGEIYATNEKHGLTPTLPMTEYGPAIPPYVIDRMLKLNPLYGLAEISRSLKCYEAEHYPVFSMPRSLQAELMPEERIGLFAGLRR